MAGVHVCLDRMNLFIKTKGAKQQQSSLLSARLKVAETLLGRYNGHIRWGKSLVTPTELLGLGSLFCSSLCTSVSSVAQLT